MSSDWLEQLQASHFEAVSCSSNNDEEDGAATIAGFASAQERAAYIARMGASPLPLICTSSCQGGVAGIVERSEVGGDQTAEEMVKGGCQRRTEDRGISDSEHRDELEQAEMRSKELTRDGKARNLSREARKVLAIMRQIEEMEKKEKTDKADAWSNQLERRVGHGNEKVGEKRRFHEACNTGGGEAAAQEPRGEGGGTWAEKLEKKRRTKTKHKQGGFEGNKYQEREDKDQERKELVGSKIFNEFAPFCIFEGVIKHIRRKQGAQFVYQDGTQHRVVQHMYHVVYEDGVSEDSIWRCHKFCLSSL